MLPPVGWLGLSNPSGTTTWTRTMLRPSRAPAAPSQPPPCGRAEPHPPPIRHTLQKVVRGSGGRGSTRDDLRPLDRGAARQVALPGRVAPAVPDTARDLT